MPDVLLIALALSLAQMPAVLPDDAFPGANTRLAIDVDLAVMAPLPSTMLDTARAEIVRLLAPSGLDVRFRTIPRPISPRAPRRLDVRVLNSDDPLAPPTVNGVLGTTLRYREGESPRFSVVYVDRIKAAVRPRTRGIVLGRVLAHEIVHQVAGPGSHTPSGLMAADWTRERICGPLEATALPGFLRARIASALADPLAEAARLSSPGPPGRPVASRAVPP